MYILVNVYPSDCITVTITTKGVIRMTTAEKTIIAQPPQLYYSLQRNNKFVKYLQARTKCIITDNFGAFNWISLDVKDILRNLLHISIIGKNVYHLQHIHMNGVSGEEWAKVLQINSGITKLLF